MTTIFEGAFERTLDTLLTTYGKEAARGTKLEAWLFDDAASRKAAEQKLASFGVKAALRSAYKPLLHFFLEEVDRAALASVVVRYPQHEGAPQNRFLLEAYPLAALLGIYSLPAAAFGGGLVTTLLLYRIATRHGQTSVATMLLAGIALGALALAMTGLLIYMANDQQLRDLTFWSMGSLAGATWTKIAAATPIILLSFTALPFMARGLNAITLGEAAAFHMGVPVQRLKNVAIVGVAAATGASVAVSGGIGFVGIVVPHILRMAIGPDHRFLLPAAALLGGSLLIFADVLARTLVAPAELPIGIITAAVGGPFFLWILLRQRSRLAL